MAFGKKLKIDLSHPVWDEWIEMTSNNDQASWNEVSSRLG